MRIRIKWMKRERVPAGEMRLGHLKRTLEAALSTARYRCALEQAGLGSREAIEALTRLGGALEKLPCVPRDEYLSQIEEFYSSGGPPPDLQPFRFPFEPVPRTAVLMPGFEQSGPVRVFSGDWLKRLERFQPEAIAAPVRVLRHLCASAGRATNALAGLKNAVIVFTGPADGDITDEDRDMFWRIFQVPVFEQFLGFDGRLVAWECEAHQGLHVAGENAIVEASGGPDSELLLTSLTDRRHPALRVFTGFSAVIEPAICECGRSEPRLAGLRIPAEVLAAACACAAD